MESHVVNAWIGNSRQVAEKHYLQVTDDHFVRALQICARNPSQDPANDKSDARETAENRDVSQCVASSMGDIGFEPTTSAV